MLMAIADGVWWRRALDPHFKAESALPIFMDITRHMLRKPAVWTGAAHCGEVPR